MVEETPIPLDDFRDPKHSIYDIKVLNEDYIQIYTESTNHTTMI